MKHNWTYKKLGEVATINYGTRVVQKRDGGTIYPVYGGGDATFRMDTYNRENCLVVARFAMSPKCTRRVVGKFFLNDSGLTLEAKEGVCQDYLDWHIIALNDEIYRTAKGAAQKNLDVKTFTSLSIGVPSLDEQQAIVRELDGINRLIDLQEEQLREYDRLAQSLFYTTFGDPSTNPKGWEVKKLGEVCDVRDGTHDSPQYLQHSDYLLITSKNIVDGRIDFSTATNYISKEDYDAINKRSKVDVGDIIMPMIGTIGHPIIVREAEQRYCIKNVALIKFCGNSDVVNTYVKMLIDSPSYMQYILGLNKGGTQKFIALGTIRQLSLPIPPLSLQQSFAVQIEAIEQQKALIRRSLDDTRTLLAARMQYYFNS